LPYVRAPLLAACVAATLLPLSPSTSATAASPRPASRPAAASAVDGTHLFRELTGFTIARGDKVRVRPRDYTAYDVDLAGVRQSLAGADGARVTKISVPDPSGHPVAFEVTEDSVMQHQLQAAHPEIRTYAGRAADGSGRSVRLDVTPMGFHAFVRSPGGQSSWYVDPVSNRRGETRHVSYFGAALPAEKQPFVERELLDQAGDGPTPQVAAGPGGVVTRRTYRLALVTDPTYADYFAHGADEATSNSIVLAEKTTLINRVNELYNDDLAIKFVLINGTDTKLNLNTRAEASEPNGPCGADACYSPDYFYADGTPGDAPDGCTGGLLSRNEFVLGQLVGAENFDLGHIGLGVNGGGIAGLGVVGGAFKADGCTGLPKPDGDFYAVDYVAHEMGHEMGGNHTFNGTQANCSTGNRNIDAYTTQVEPGSGSSVMAYAGICGQDNLQPHSDPYFSFVSIEEITDTTSAAPGTVDEQQVVAFTDPDGAGADTGFDGTDAVTLSCPGCGAPVTIINGPGYQSGAQVATAVQQLTGHTPQVGNYDEQDPVSGGPSGTPSSHGFTIAFPVDGSGEDIPRLQATPTTGAFGALVGTTYNGGPETNQGATATVANHAPAVTALR
jgi:hypothetical protein